MHVGWLGHGKEDQAHEATAFYINEAEDTGCFGEQVRILAVMLIPKPAGGRRPICQFVSLLQGVGQSQEETFGAMEAVSPQ